MIQSFFLSNYFNPQAFGHVFLSAYVFRDLPFEIVGAGKDEKLHFKIAI